MGGGRRVGGDGGRRKGVGGVCEVGGWTGGGRRICGDGGRREGVGGLGRRRSGEGRDERGGIRQCGVEA